MQNLRVLKVWGILVVLVGILGHWEVQCVVVVLQRHWCWLGSERKRMVWGAEWEAEGVA